MHSISHALTRTRLKRHLLFSHTFVFILNRTHCSVQYWYTYIIQYQERRDLTVKDKQRIGISMMTSGFRQVHWLKVRNKKNWNSILKNWNSLYHYFFGSPSPQHARAPIWLPSLCLHLKYFSAFGRSAGHSSWIVGQSVLKCTQDSNWQLNSGQILPFKASFRFNYKNI